MKLVETWAKPAEGNDDISLCSLIVAEENFGIATSKVREVLGQRELVRVPMAPPFVAGVVAYRGDVLTVVSFRALLGKSPALQRGCVLVLEDVDHSERFGLEVDRIGGVVVVDGRLFEPNPSTLDARCRPLFDGAFKMESELIIQLHPQKLRPSRLAEVETFRHINHGEAA